MSIPGMGESDVCNQQWFRPFPECNAFVFGCYLFVLLLLSACQPTQVSAPEPVTITIAGSSGMRPVLAALSAEFTQQYPHVVFDLRGGGSHVGEEQVRTGEIDLAASTLPPATNDSERPPIDTIQPIPIAVDGLAIIIHPSNLFTAITIDQLAAIFIGDTLTWSALDDDNRDLGFNDIVLVSREDGSGARQLFEERVVQRGRKERQVALTAIVMPTSLDVVRYVSQNPAAIGYVSRAYVADQLRTPTGETTQIVVKVLEVDGSLPSIANLHNASYPLIQPIYLVSRGEPVAWPRQFIDFVLSPVGQEIVGEFHARLR